MRSKPRRRQRYARFLRDGGGSTGRRHGQRRHREEAERQKDQSGDAHLPENCAVRGGRSPQERRREQEEQQSACSTQQGLRHQRQQRV